MLKKNIYISLGFVMMTTLLLSFQNCGQSAQQAIVADGKIVLEDFVIVDNDCSAGETCKMTVAKIKSSTIFPDDINPEVSVNKINLKDEDIPKEFFHMNESGIYLKCVLVNRRDDIRYEYMCNK